MKKGEKTKQHIIEQSSIVLNRYGYISTSLAEIVKATGLQKGGIYNHFAEKEELFLQAYDYCSETNFSRIKEVVLEKPGAVTRLLAFIEASTALDIPGGCPIANAAIQTDNICDTLMEHARGSMRELTSFVEGIIQSGIDAGELRAEVNPAESAIVIISAVEGALLMGKLYENHLYPIGPVRHYLSHYVENMLSAL